MSKEKESTKYLLIMEDMSFLPWPWQTYVLVVCLKVPNKQLLDIFQVYTIQNVIHITL